MKDILDAMMEYWQSMYKLLTGHNLIPDEWLK